MTAITEAPTETVSACPVCGAYSGTTLAQAPALLAVCDVLVVRALEVVGKRIVRAPGSPRSRYPQAKKQGWHNAHTVWPADAHVIDKGLEGAWDVIPAMLDNHGCCGVTSVQVTRMVDSYVRDLLVTGTPHQLSELRYRFERYLSIPLVEPKPYEPSRP